MSPGMKRRMSRCIHLAPAQVNGLVALGSPGAHDVQSVRAGLQVVLVGQALGQRGIDCQAVQSSKP